MTTVTELLQPVELDLEALLTDLRSLIGAGHPILQAAAEHLFSAGGKRIRPGIVLLISRALSPEGALSAKHRKLAQITEMIHTARLIPIGLSSHIDESIRQWFGDSRAYWDGDTLVVETENFNDHDLHFNWRGSSTNMKLVERFRRVDADTLSYEFTVTDPETWVTPWTAEVPMKRNELPLFEYACHEGNYSMEVMLGGARAEERKAAQGGQ